MSLALVFNGDGAYVSNNYVGASVHEYSMVVPLNNVSEELKEKLNLFNDSKHNTISQKELVKYCIDSKLVTTKNAEVMLKDFYTLD